MKKLLRTRLQLALLATAGLLLHAGSVHAQTPPPSPVGTWDTVISGSQSGLAILTFNPDFTISGREILRPLFKKAPTPPPPDPRYPGGPPERMPLVPGTGTSNVSSTTITETNFLGSAALGGLWTYDTKGKPIGFLDQISQVVEPVEQITTNIVDGFVFFTTNIVLLLKFETNSVSFRSTVKPGKSLTLYSYGPAGNNTLRGVPAVPVTDITGSFYGQGKRAGLPFVELLTLAPSGADLNHYSAVGAGPGYTYGGQAIVSKQKQIALLTLTDSESPVLTVYTGPFNLTTRRGTSLKGNDSADAKLTYKLVHQ